jgi:glycosyltransferase involved in cell wall biosynthesis
MRILYIASRFPFPPWRGDMVRGYQQIRALGRRHDITLIAPEPPAGMEAGLAQMRAVCRPVLVPVPLWRRAVNALRFPVSRLPAQTLFFYTPAFDRAVEEAAGEAPFDLVHVLLARMGPAALRAGNIPCVMDMVDTLSLNLRRRAERENPLIRMALAPEIRRLIRYERELVQCYDRILVTSPDDLKALGSPPNGAVLPLGVDLGRLPFREEGREEPRVVFTGRMAYFPNADAAEYLARRIFPLVRRAVPRATLEIVGVDPPARVAALGRLAGVRVIADAVLPPYIDRAAVAAAPLRSGTGIQLKVLEAMASGAPVVGSSFVAPAIGARSGEHWFLADDPEEFAARVIQLLADRPLARRMAAAARRLVEERYAVERLAGDLERIWTDAVRKGSGRGTRQPAVPAQNGCHTRNGRP